MVPEEDDDEDDDDNDNDNDDDDILDRRSACSFLSC